MRKRENVSTQVRLTEISEKSHAEGELSRFHSVKSNVIRVKLDVYRTQSTIIKPIGVHQLVGFPSSLGLTLCNM